MGNIQEAEITTKGIQKALNKYTPERAISEYVWNGFDADASIVEIHFHENSLNAIDTISIIDNGIGIDYTKLNEKFKRVFESSKGLKSSDGHKLKGKNGYGRFTFFKLATDAKWNTCFSVDSKQYEYSINIASESLRRYESSEPVEVSKNTGTEVVLQNVNIKKESKNFINDVKKYLIADFSWFLALNPSKHIFIDGDELSIASYIGEHEQWEISINEKVFKADYFRWNGKLNEEYSKFYYLSLSSNLVHEETTKLNKKGDNFWHTVIVKDSFYDDVILENFENGSLFKDENKLKIHKTLENELNNRLKEKRRPYLHNKAVQFIEKCQNDKTFPVFKNNPWDNVRKNELEELVIEFYEVEPQIFIKLTKNQQKVLLALLNLIMDTDAREDLFTILDELVELEDSDRNTFANILKRTKLKYVVDMANLIKDRLDTISDLKQILFNHELNAGEVKHLQPVLENHYWIFGEEFNLVCAEEVKFEEALRRYKYYLYGVDEKSYIENPDKYKEMDLFLAGSQCKTTGYKQNLIIEIKSPTNVPKLTSKEYTQIQKYINVINSTDEFKTDKTEWVYYLIGQDYDDIVEMNIQVDKKTGLAIKDANYKLYVKRWSDIIADVEARLTYLQNKIKLTQKQYSDTVNIEDVMADLNINNSASMPGEIKIPRK
ncbi:MAG: ATP-binding protein [Spirochaetales bacterium]|nr:ATP-binding protein [Spirochaetales bacterium]